MTLESATTTYTIAEPFDRAVQMVRRALAGADLRITGELNMSGRIQRSLMIQTAPCVVLFVCPAAAPESFSADRAATALTPLHVVVSSRGSQTDVHVLHVLPHGVGKSEASPVLSRMVMVMGQAIEAVGMRAGVAA